MGGEQQKKRVARASDERMDGNLDIYCTKQEQHGKCRNALSSVWQKTAAESRGAGHNPGAGICALVAAAGYSTVQSCCCVLEML